MDLQELNELSLKDAGDWPVIVKILLFLILAGGIVGAGYYFDVKDQYLTLEQVEKKELDLRREFERKQTKAVNLEAYRKQLAEMEVSFGAMLRQLPDKTEVAGLLVDVSQTGLAAGLEFELFQPRDEIRQDFYAELPISITVLGDYHEFGEFVSGLAALPRIVTIHNIQISPAEGQLRLRATAKTYRYLEGDG